MKIAFTYQNAREITGHAGKTSRFLIYTLDDSHQIVNLEVVNLQKEDILHMRFHESPEPYAPHPIFDVDILITGGAGSGFVNRMANQSVNVLITSETDPETALKLLISQKLPILTSHNHHHH